MSPINDHLVTILHVWPNFNLNYPLSKSRTCLCLATKVGQHKTTNHIYVAHHVHTQSHVGILTSGGVKQPTCQPLEQWSQTNMVVPPCYSSHNMHHKLDGTMATDRSTWPSMCGRWHLCTIPHMVFPYLTILTFQ